MGTPDVKQARAVEPPVGSRAPDDEDRIREFLDRHGRPARPLRETRGADGSSGRWEIGAADGYTLHCTWSRTGSRQQMEFSELPPGAAAGDIT